MAPGSHMLPALPLSELPPQTSPKVAPAVMRNEPVAGPAVSLGKVLPPPQQTS